MIEMDGVTKSYTLGETKVPILKGISLFIGKGEFVSIMGPSGSGKSTLSAILGLLSKPSDGAYLLDGDDTAIMGGSHVAGVRNRKIGFIFQDFNLLDGLSAIENVALPLVYAGVSSRDRHDRALECLRSVGLDGKVDYLPNQLSGGQRQRVAIARALVNKPAFLFADEPTGALDKKTGQEIMGLLQKLNMQGQTIVQVTHSAADANYSKRILHLLDGLIVRDEVVERPTIGIFHDEESLPSLKVTRLWQLAQEAMPDERSLSALEKLHQQSKKPWERVEAVRALIRWHQPKAEALIDELFRDENWAVRVEVLKSSVTRGPEYALGFHWKALDDTNPWVRFLGASYLARIRWKPSDDFESDKVLRMISDGDERVRATIAGMVGDWARIEVRPALMKLLEDVEGRVRANSIQSLRRFLTEAGGDDVARELEKHFDDKHNRARANAAVALYAREPKKSLNTLIGMMHSGNNLMRGSGAWALGEVGAELAAPVLLERLELEREDMVLNQILRSLARLAKNGFPLHRQFSALMGVSY